MCVRKDFIINNEAGIHARPATAFVQAISDYESEINVYNLDTGGVANGRSIISILMLAVPKGAKIRLEIDGYDEQEVLDTLSNLIENNFNE